jgi:hypothetical protein
MSLKVSISQTLGKTVVSTAEPKVSGVVSLGLLLGAMLIFKDKSLQCGGSSYLYFTSIINLLKCTFRFV